MSVKSSGLFQNISDFPEHQRKERSEYLLPVLSGTAMAGTFACGQTEIVHDAAGSTGFGPAAVAEFFHPVCQQILMIFSHIGIGQIFPETVKTEYFLADLVFSHAPAYPDGFVIQSRHSNRFAPGFEMMDGRHIKRFDIPLHIIAG